MTVEEAYAIYGAKSYTTSSGDTLTSVIRYLYNSDDTLYYFILTTLNQRVDWDNLEPNVTIFYLQSSVTGEIVIVN